jgi:pilus assembly protein Flp/PilA
VICIRHWIRDESGQDMVEYGLLAALISIVALVTIRLIGPMVAALFELVRSEIAG